jgi:hypothetical protein
MTESHEQWDELVAAHSLHALDPEDEARLRAHLERCPRCATSLDDFTLVAAQLGSIADDDAPPPAWRKIRSGVVAAPAASPGGSPLPMPRRRLPVRMLAAAAAVVVLAAGAVTGWQVTHRSSSPSMTAALAACRDQAECRIIRLHGQSGDSAAVIVRADGVSLVPDRLPSPAESHMYVLWQLPRDGSPTPVVTFRDTHRQTNDVPLVTAYDDTAAFAVSLEPTGPMPSKPTRVLAVGAAAA